MHTQMSPFTHPPSQRYPAIHVAASLPLTNFERKVLDAHCAWADAQGYDLDPDYLFDPDLIDSYVRELSETKANSTAGNHRSTLRSIATRAGYAPEGERNLPSSQSSTRAARLFIHTRTANSSRFAHGRPTVPSHAMTLINPRRLLALC